MVDLGVALTWIAISAASAKGLSAFARAAANTEVEEEIAAGAHDEGMGDEEFYGRYRIEAPANPVGVCL